MTAQRLGTKIHTATDIEMTALLNTLDGDTRLAIACKLLGKNIANYQHLDKGRRSMTGSNLLRGAARKDASFVEKVRGFTDGRLEAKIEAYGTHDKKAVETQLAEEDEVASFTVKGEGSLDIEWPSNPRYKFAQKQEDGYKFFYNAPKTGDYVTR